jgi:hypothetical protein
MCSSGPRDNVRPFHLLLSAWMRFYVTYLGADRLPAIPLQTCPPRRYRAWHGCAASAATPACPSAPSQGVCAVIGSRNTPRKAQKSTGRFLSHIQNVWPCPTLGPLWISCMPTLPIHQIITLGCVLAPGTHSAREKSALLSQPFFSLLLHHPHACCNSQSETSEHSCAHHVPIITPCCLQMHSQELLLQQLLLHSGRGLLDPALRMQAQAHRARPAQPQVCKAQVRLQQVPQPLGVQLRPPLVST